MNISKDWRYLQNNKSISTKSWKFPKFPGQVSTSQGWAIPGFGHQYYTQYYTSQKYAKLYNTLYQYYTKSNHLISSVNQQQSAISKSNLIIE